MAIYFDNAATTRVSEEAASAVLKAMREDFGNPSSSHSLGISANRILEEARAEIARAIGAKPKNIYFTSGGTEADNIAILSGAELMKRRGKHILTTAIEHEAVLKSMNELERLGFEVEYLKPDSTGRVSLESFENALRDDTVLVSIMLVNNETGAVQPVSEVAGLIKRRSLSAILHSDAVQGFLEVSFSVKSLGADIISLSAHKIHGPKGVGAIYVREGLRLPPRSFGGGQESDFRPGTESVPLIAGYGAAVKAGMASMEKDIALKRELKDEIKRRLKENIPEVVFVGTDDAPHILCVSIPGYRSEVLLNWLGAKGIFVSKGSACKKGRRSHVLSAMGLDNAVVDGAIRLSFSAENTLEEAEFFISALKQAKSEIMGTAGR